MPAGRDSLLYGHATLDRGRPRSVGRQTPPTPNQKRWNRLDLAIEHLDACVPYLFLCPKLLDGPAPEHDLLLGGAAGAVVLAALGPGALAGGVVHARNMLARGHVVVVVLLGLAAHGGELLLERRDGVGVRHELLVRLLPRPIERDPGLLELVLGGLEPGADVLVGGLGGQQLRRELRRRLRLHAELVGLLLQGGLALLEQALLLAELTLQAGHDLLLDDALLTLLLVGVLLEAATLGLGRLEALVGGTERQPELLALLIRLG
ncbi:hypothetical protein PG993_005710 [Apiospora rasikravindrae]|uniref:Uncharacterized protein n=1 Tax=Apiospora rasikravindrae TaxID=990691 RepID=A0ABR1TBD4_9PEZI